MSERQHFGDAALVVPALSVAMTSKSWPHGQVKEIVMNDRTGIQTV
ncbi:hypothetical protein [Demequina globuliformis]|nr:hypothetical protein [Demequina globuliformis]